MSQLNQQAMDFCCLAVGDKWERPAELHMLEPQQVVTSSAACLPENKLWKGLLGGAGRESLADDTASCAACLGSSGMAAFTDEAASCTASWGLLPPAATGSSHGSLAIDKAGATICGNKELGAKAPVPRRSYKAVRWAALLLRLP